MTEEITIGSRILAPFGKRNITGIAMEFPESTNLKRLKSIVKVLDAEPVLTEEMISFCRWISRYYICPIGEVIFSAVPKGILVESKILYSVNEDFDISNTGLTDLQEKIISE